MAMDINDAGDNPGDGQWMTYGELAEIRQIGRRAAVRLAQRHRLRRQPGNDGATRVLVPSTLATLPSHRPTASPVDDAGVNGAVAEANRRADEAHKRADTALALVDKTLAQLTEERARADALRERLEFELGMARGAVQQAQDAAEQLRQAEAARKARRLLARLRAAVRGE
jgi:hypothetical protein